MTEQEYKYTKEYEMVKKLGRYVESIDSDLFDALDYGDGDYSEVIDDIEKLEKYLAKLKKELA